MLGSIVYLCLALWRHFSNIFENLYITSYIRNNGGTIGKGFRSKGKCVMYIGHNSKIEIGDDVRINSGPYFAADAGVNSKLYIASGALFKIGKGSGFSNTCISCHNQIAIGRHVDIGAGCFLFDTNFHSINYLVRMDNRSDSDVKTSPIIIEDNVFIGARCIICKGVTIGARSIIAAGSVVVKDIPQDCIAGGNPCKIIKRIN